jgi:hypothetical protein
MEEEFVCSLCGGKMKLGYILDRGQHCVPQTAAEWVEGLPEASIWTGLRVKGKERYRIESFRCGTCGRLDSFARTRIE